jgi:hypothetical protein
MTKMRARPGQRQNTVTNLDANLSSVGMTTGNAASSESSWLCLPVERKKELFFKIYQIKF